MGPAVNARRPGALVTPTHRAHRRTPAPRSATRGDDRIALTREWILGEALLLPGGGIAGWWPEGESPGWAYPEITGYYLTTLAFIATSAPEHAARCRDRARPALEWLDRIVRPDHPPLTRYYVGATAKGQDWRNEASFSFDLGMALRGVAAAGQLLGDRPAVEPLRQRLEAQLLALTKDGLLDSHHMLDGSAPATLPPKWSTRPGPHHAKVAGAMLLAEVGGQALEVARNTVRHYAARAELEPTSAHASAYFLEGLLQAWARTRDPALWSGCSQLFDRFWSALPEDACAGHQRADVTAQTLRMAAVFRRDPEAAGATATLRRRLHRSIDADGAVHFDTLGSGTPAAGHINAWATFFAHQALVFDAENPHPSWLELIV